MVRTIKSEKVLVDLLSRGGLKIAAAESCTGGLVAGSIISVSGASNIIEGAFVVYSDRMKNELLGVRQNSLDVHGAVSAEVAAQMAMGARIKTGADIGISTTGYAGPDGDDVGLVYIGISSGRGSRVYKFKFLGSRNKIRRSAVKMAIAAAIKEVEEWKK